MIGARIKSAGAKALFDPGKPRKVMERATYRVLGRFGAYVRRVARNSIRKRNRAARPGEAPSRVTDQLRGNILFAVEPVNRSVVVGPQKVSSLDADAPRLLEEGGKARRRFWLEDENGYLHDPTNVPPWAGAITRALYSEDAPEVSVNYDPHPYMGPAAEKGRAKLDSFWAASVQ